MLQFLSNYRDFGLLVMRAGLGIAFVIHGYPKILGGPHLWAKVGAAVQHVGFGHFFVFWGFMAALSELLGGILLALGLAFRPACAFLFVTMCVASTMLWQTAKGFSGAAHPLELALVFFGLFFVGPGKYSFDKS